MTTLSDHCPSPCPLYVLFPMLVRVLLCFPVFQLTGNVSLHSGHQIWRAFYSFHVKAHIPRSEADERSSWRPRCKAWSRSHRTVHPTGIPTLQ